MSPAAVVTKREHLRVLMWVIGLSFGFYGVKVGLSGVLSFGRIKVLQGPGGMLEDNNNFGLALAMGLPLLIQIALSEKNKTLRRGFFLMIPLMVLTIVLTHSRGAALSLGAMIFTLIWRSRNRFAGFAIAGLGALTGRRLRRQVLPRAPELDHRVRAGRLGHGAPRQFKTGAQHDAAQPLLRGRLRPVPAQLLEVRLGLVERGQARRAQRLPADHGGVRHPRLPVLHVADRAELLGDLEGAPAREAAVLLDLDPRVRRCSRPRWWPSSSAARS